VPLLILAVYLLIYKAKVYKLLMGGQQSQEYWMEMAKNGHPEETTKLHLE
jgi:hypothetical protein